MGGMVRLLNVDVDQSRPDKTPHFPASCSCGAFLLTHLSREAARAAFWQHLREPGLFGPRRRVVPVEDFADEPVRVEGERRVRRSDAGGGWRGDKASRPHVTPGGRSGVSGARR